MNITEILIEFIMEELLYGQSDEPVEPDTNLLLTGLVDSLGIMRLTLHVEETLGFQVPPEDITIENFLTVSDMTRYLEAKLAVA
ncbi:MAG: acyl carrier protein [Chloroflexota bacterium]